MSDTAERTWRGNHKHCIGQAFWDLPKNTVLMECWKLNVESMRRESGTVSQYCRQVFRKMAVKGEPPEGGTWVVALSGPRKWCFMTAWLTAEGPHEEEQETLPFIKGFPGTMLNITPVF